MRHAFLFGAASLMAAGSAWAVDVRTGQAVYGDWRADAPGVMRHIAPADVVTPGSTESAANRSKVVPRPDGAALKTMPDFAVAPFVAGMEGARVLRVAPNGDVFLSRSRPDGKIIVIRSTPGAAKPDLVATFAETDLHDPYGIAFWPPGPNPRYVYVGETGKVIRFPYKNGDVAASGPAETIVSDLAIGGSHWTRDVAFSPDGRTMYVAVGSQSNIAADMGKPPADLAAFQKSHAPGAAWDRNEWRADVLTYTPEGKNKAIYADGIRNCSGLTIQPGTGVVWCATNERDLLGDNTPPDYVTSVKQGGFYGWPWYYIGNHADDRPGGGPRPDLAGKAIVPDVLIQPHSAPLGLAFDTSSQFPAAWKGDAFVALHGSWNRALHTGYKIVRLPFKDGKPTGEYQDFVTGFAVNDEAVWGRPVDVTFAADGALLFSDDANGTVYRVTYSGK
jgi:glucose/arabinose dehydrogenase